MLESFWKTLKTTLRNKFRSERSTLRNSCKGCNVNVACGVAHSNETVRVILYCCSEQLT